LQVHDEVALSVKQLKRPREAADIMAKAVNLEVPSRVDVGDWTKLGKPHNRDGVAAVALFSFLPGACVRYFF
jgi:hypothetical protein